MIVIELAHLGVFLLLVFYAFIFKKNKGYDFIYVTWSIIMAISWIVFDDECLFSVYYTKVFIDPTYELGQGYSKIDEILDNLFQQQNVDFIMNVLFTIYVYSMYVVFSRNKFVKPYIWITVLFIFFMYLFGIVQSSLFRIAALLVYSFGLFKLSFTK